MKKKIYIIEDDPSINHGIELSLGSEKYEFSSFFCLKDVKDPASADLIILDVNLPDGSGFDFLRELRKSSQVPVLILTANDTELDEVTGLSLGADDYVTKPFSLMALRLRVEKLIGRSASTFAYDKNGLSLDFDGLRFLKNGNEIELSKTEIRLLRCFTENEGVTLSRDKLIDYVWQNEQFVDESALTVSVKRLRDKIEDKNEKLIHTVYGIGYVFKQEQ
ncbi:MAG: response regulator transcription factor [Lachnospiraceae bacterium]|nr:response regulator transcription factor [Lachnospiraceae bacterium]